MLEIEKVAKVANNYYCEKCDYICSKLYNWNKHLDTAKHIQETNGNDLVAKSSKIEQKYCCEKCKKYFHTNSGLWKHNKKCIIDSNKMEESDILKNENLIQYLMKENSEFKNLIMELIKKDCTNNNINTTNNNINSNNTICNNNSFNLNVFLNEKCKGAMNMSEFVDTIKVQLSDLEHFAHVDYADGVSKILLKNLNNLDTYLRPIHCSDLKRETVYIKENDCWTRETDDKPNLKKAIKQVAFKNIKQINEWVKENPGCQDPRTKQNVKYNKIVMNSMSGTTAEEQTENIEKIVKNVTKAVTIEKNTIK